MAIPLTAQRRVAELTPAERKAAREAADIPAEALAAPCYVTAPTIRQWERGVEPRNRLAFKCYLETLQELLDKAVES